MFKKFASISSLGVSAILIRIGDPEILKISVDPFFFFAFNFAIY